MAAGPDGYFWGVRANDKIPFLGRKTSASGLFWLILAYSGLFWLIPSAAGLECAAKSAAEGGRTLHYWTRT